MIGIRSVTYFLPYADYSADLKEIKRASYLWGNQEYFLRTQRIALSPCRNSVNFRLLEALAEMCESTDIRWFNIPIQPMRTCEKKELFAFAEAVLARYGHAFVNVLVAENGNMENEVIARSAELIKRVGRLNSNGMDNFRLGCSLNVNPDGPFFPFTMASERKGFSLALELTQDINALCAHHHRCTLQELQSILRQEMERQISGMMETAEEISRKCDIPFRGFDFSLAPIIEKEGSVVPILNRLGIYNFGRTGILFATSFLTDILKSLAAQFPSVGFSGVMYSLLEDMELCRINNERGISLDELISLSTMCGCGLDMVPVPGDITVAEIHSIFLEVYAISTRLGKPLGIRILPIPASRRGQVGYTNMSNDADFVANTKVLKLDTNLLAEMQGPFSYLNHYAAAIECK